MYCQNQHQQPFQQRQNAQQQNFPKYQPPSQQQQNQKPIQFNNPQNINNMQVINIAVAQYQKQVVLNPKQNSQQYCDQSPQKKELQQKEDLFKQKYIKEFKELKIQMKDKYKERKQIQRERLVLIDSSYDD